MKKINYKSYYSDDTRYFFAKISVNEANKYCFSYKNKRKNFTNKLFKLGTFDYIKKIQTSDDILKFIDDFFEKADIRDTEYGYAAFVCNLYLKFIYIAFDIPDVSVLHFPFSRKELKELKCSKINSFKLEKECYKEKIKKCNDNNKEDNLFLYDLKAYNKE